MTISPIDVSTSEIGAFPGDFLGIGLSDESVQLETFAVMDIDIVDAATGAPVDLAAGATAGLTFLLPETTSLAVGDTVGLWFYDEAAGAWVEEEVGTVEAASLPGRLQVVGEVSHFSSWNCDRPIDTFNCFTGQVVDPAGNPVGGAAVFATGVDYFGTSYDTTDASGSYCVNVRRNSTVEIKASLTSGGISVDSQTVVVDTTLPDGDIVSCDLGGCSAVEPLMLSGLTCISGDVRDEADVPLEGVTVFSTSGQTAVTAADGSYCFAAPAESDVAVFTADFPALVVTTGPEGDDCSDPAGCTEANLRPGGPGEGACISGAVLTDGNPAILDGLIVNVFRESPPFDILGATITQPDGTFCVDGLPIEPALFVRIDVVDPEGQCGGLGETFDLAPFASTCSADDCIDIGNVICSVELIPS